MSKEDEIFRPGQALIIADGAQLQDAIEKIVIRSMEKYYATEEQSAKDKDWVEQYVAAEMLGVSIWTLKRKAKAGQIDRVVDNTTRSVMYYLRDILREKTALDAKRALKHRKALMAAESNGNQSLGHENKNTLSDED